LIEQKITYRMHVAKGWVGVTRPPKYLQATLQLFC